MDRYAAVGSPEPKHIPLPNFSPQAKRQKQQKVHEYVPKIYHLSEVEHSLIRNQSNKHIYYLSEIEGQAT